VRVLSIENNKPYYYTWKDNNKRQLKVNNNQSEHAIYMQEKMKAYTTMQTANIYSDIQKHLLKKGVKHIANK
jgi:DNA repair protein RadC